MPMPLIKSWRLQDAKNQFSAMADLASEGKPQIVTRRGQPLVVVVSYAWFEEKMAPKRRPKSILAAFRACPEDLGDLLQPRKRKASSNRKVVF